MSYNILKLRSNFNQINVKEFRKLKLPSSYLSFIQQYVIEDLVIGYLDFSVSQCSSLIETLSVVNGPAKNPYLTSDMVQVGNFEADLIMMKKRSQFYDDNAVYIQDISTGFFPDPMKLTNDFGEFICLMLELQSMIIKDGNVTFGDFIEELSQVKVNQIVNHQQAWKYIIDTVLSH